MYREYEFETDENIEELLSKNINPQKKETFESIKDPFELIEDSGLMVRLKDIDSLYPHRIRKSIPSEDDPDKRRTLAYYASKPNNQPLIDYHKFMTCNSDELKEISLVAMKSKEKEEKPKKRFGIEGPERRAAGNLFDKAVLPYMRTLPYQISKCNGDQKLERKNEHSKINHHRKRNGKYEARFYISMDLKKWCWMWKPDTNAIIMPLFKDMFQNSEELLCLFSRLTSGITYLIYDRYIHFSEDERMLQNGNRKLTEGRLQMIWGCITRAMIKCSLRECGAYGEILFTGDNQIVKVYVKKEMKYSQSRELCEKLFKGLSENFNLIGHTLKKSETWISKNLHVTCKEMRFNGERIVPLCRIVKNSLVPAPPESIKLWGPLSSL